MPQGIAALLAMNPEEGLDENAHAMEEGRQLVRTVEVTRAVRSTSISGVKVQAGQCIAIVDDELKLSAASPEQAALQALEALAGGGTSLVTLYYGADTDEIHAKALAEHLCERLTGYEVEVVFGRSAALRLRHLSGVSPAHGTAAMRSAIPSNVGWKSTTSVGETLVSMIRPWLKSTNESPR